MSDSIIVRVTLDSYDVLRPSAKQTQVYVQIPEVARASWLLDEDMYHFLKSEPWPNAVDSAQEWYRQSGAVTDSVSTASRAQVIEWLRDDANHDEMQVAWEEDRARRDPVTRKLRAEVDRLRARVTELEAGRKTLAVRLRAGQRWQQGRTPALITQDYVSQDELRTMFGIPLVAPWDEDPCLPCGCPKRFARHADGCPTLAAESADKLTALLAPTQALREDEPDEKAGRHVEWCTGCTTDHDPDQCGYQPETGGAR